MKLDSNLAWKQASSAIAANREVLLALAGVFYLLPGLAIALLVPQPEMAPGVDQEAMMAVMSDYYVSVLPFVIPMVLFQAAGTLALLTLLTDLSRPTVGEAIKLGLKGVLPYVLAQLILGVVLGIAAGLILGIAAATGVAAVTAIGLAALFLLVLYAAIRTSLAAPVIAVEGELNPLSALKRSWRLTKDNTLRLGALYLLVIVAFVVIALVVTALTGILMTLVAGQETSEIVTVVISSALNAIMALYFVAIVAAVHRQLVGPSPRTDSATFE